MHRRGDELRKGLLLGPLLALLGFAAFVLLVSVLFFVNGRSSDTVAIPTLPTLAGDLVITTTPPAVTDFYPEDSNLSDCLGLVERPGCGSKSRGGWGQNVVFVLLVLGVGTVILRVSIGVRKNREELDA